MRDLSRSSSGRKTSTIRRPRGDDTVSIDRAKAAMQDSKVRFATATRKGVLGVTNVRRASALREGKRKETKPYRAVAQKGAQETVQAHHNAWKPLINQVRQEIKHKQSEPSIHLALPNASPGRFSYLFRPSLNKHSPSNRSLSLHRPRQRSPYLHKLTHRAPAPVTGKPQLAESQTPGAPVSSSPKPTSAPPPRPPPPVNQENPQRYPSEPPDAPPPTPDLTKPLWNLH
ncbi:leucine-rich repeat extensin-like protein 3 [Penaeus monodon]|uniref:leucine-rich repeat extensin-like protein 3 n=1 Tax=Penaeus monodon TaxID=6687 RepID=UPI0018A7029E|nr:leucine-rich repeat extensin-like protein 3 [Penaeus monodon]